MKNGEDFSYWQLVEPIWNDVSIYDGAQTFLVQFQRLPQAVGDLYAAHWVVSEVMNGAFPQFFSNSTGVLAPEAVDALKRIGLEDAADALAHSMTYFGDEYPRERVTRAPQIDWVWESEHSESDEHDFQLMLDVSGEFLDALGKDQTLFKNAADAYALRYFESIRDID